MKGLVAVGVVVAIIAGGAYWATSRTTTDVIASELTYAVAERRTIASTVLATGVIRLKVGAEVRVGAQLSGIVEELNAAQGSPQDIGGYYRPDPDRAAAAMRPSAALNGIIEAI